MVRATVGMSQLLTRQHRIPEGHAAWRAPLVPVGHPQPVGERHLGCVAAPARSP
jgi:hypothetical protein